MLALDGVVPFDLTAPAEVFAWAAASDDSGRPPPHHARAYDVRVCGPSREVDAGLYRLHVPWTLRALADADTVIVPGLRDINRPIPESALRALRRAAQRGVRIASVCTGAFVLAASGLLDGLRATTHWAAAAELARRYPKIDVDPEVLYVDHGAIATSAGAAAAMDLCLHLIRRDHGAAAAAQTARLTVMPLERAGGQAQFIAHEAPGQDTASLEPLQRWLEKNLHRPLTLAAMSRRAAVSPRTLNRQFREQTGTTPLQWLLRARTRRAQHLLERTDRSIEEVATMAGFGSSAAFRSRFRRVVGTSPAGYRRAFRSPGRVPSRG